MMRIPISRLQAKACSCDTRTLRYTEGLGGTAKHRGCARRCVGCGVMGVESTSLNCVAVAVRGLVRSCCGARQHASVLVTPQKRAPYLNFMLNT